jgi:hypothetical protein
MDEELTSATRRVRRYRAKQPLRIEFYPSPDVADIIRHYQSTGSDPCIAGILDGLIRAGHRAIVSGNGRSKQ